MRLSAFARDFLFFQLIHCPNNSISHESRTEVEKQTEFFIRKSQISLDLLSMNRSNVFNGFELQDDKVIYENVCTKTFIKGNIIVFKRYGNLALTYQTILTKKMG